MTAVFSFELVPNNPTSGSDTPMAHRTSLVDTARFFQSLRDSGYRTPGLALSELVDNAIDGRASRVDLIITRSKANRGIKEICVFDNGAGMTPRQLRDSLRLGGGTKAESREMLGRFGIGLPNSALSLARGLAVYSWRDPHYVWTSHLNLDAILSGTQMFVPGARRTTWPLTAEMPPYPSGTLIRLTDLDRLSARYVAPVKKKLKAQLGQTFRQFIFEGLELRLNEELITPVDPLLLSTAKQKGRATQYGDTLEFRMRDSDPDKKILGRLIKVHFSELPIKKWHTLTNLQKTEVGIARRAGVSILRAGREIDYGWFFMGRKRRENYDDWWRCQVSFEPDLDEAFGVTNTKQGIRPSAALLKTLTPHIETTARALNRRVRNQFEKIRKHQTTTVSTGIASRNSKFIPPVHGQTNNARPTRPLCRTRRNLSHYISYKNTLDDALYSPILSDSSLSIHINTLHPFGDLLREFRSGKNISTTLTPIDLIELLLLAAARTEVDLKSPQASQFRKHWGNVLNALLS